MHSEHASDLPQRSGSFHAVVRAGTNVVAYQRTGAGEPVLLLRQGSATDVLGSALLERIAEHFRVLVPLVMPDPALLPEWFAPFHDGLGIGAVRVVSDATYGVASLRLALLQRERIARLILLTPGSGQDAAGILSTDDEPADTADDPATAVQHRVQFVSGDATTTSVADRVVESLRAPGCTRA